MASSVKKAVLFVGAGMVIVGAPLLSMLIDDAASCQESVTYINQAECTQLGLMLLATSILTLLGLILVIAGVIWVACEEPKLSEFRFSCPRCHTYMNFSSSPMNCPKCGLPIDWSRWRERKR